MNEHFVKFKKRVLRDTLIKCGLAAVAAKAKGMRVLFLGGGSDGKLKEIADVSVIVPEKETFKVQELHLPVYHCLCAMLENEFFG